MDINQALNQAFDKICEDQYQAALDNMKKYPARSMGNIIVEKIHLSDFLAHGNSACKIDYDDAIDVEFEEVTERKELSDGNRL